MQFWHFLNCNYHTQIFLFFRFGPIVRSTYNVSSWKVYNFLRHDVGIKKIHTCWCCTRNPVELEHFECSLVFFFRISQSAWFFFLPNSSYIYIWANKDLSSQNWCSRTSSSCNFGFRRDDPAIGISKWSYECVDAKYGPKTWFCNLAWKLDPKNLVFLSCETQ